MGSFMGLSLIRAVAVKEMKHTCSLFSCPIIISCGAIGLKSLKSDDIDQLKVQACLIFKAHKLWPY